MFVVAEGSVQAADGAGALDRALAAAVSVVVERYVPASVRAAEAAWIQRRILGRAGAYVLRYSIRSEERGLDGVRVEVAADVDRERLLADLAARGIEARSLASWPRLLLVGASGPDADGVARRVGAVLRQQGVSVHLFPAPEAREGAVDALSAAGRQLGCHLLVALILETEIAEVQPEDFFSIEAVRPSVGVQVAGWVVATRSAETMDYVEAVGQATAGDPEAALEAATERAARKFAYRLIGVVEGSGWSPGEDSLPVDLVVTDLPDPQLLVEVGQALNGLAEVRRADLREVGFRFARWRLDVLSSDIGWGAVLAAALPTRGRLEWQSGPDAATESEPARVEARWVP